MFINVGSADVHLQYYSWETVSFMRRVPPWEEKRGLLARCSIIINTSSSLS
jgi:hypothetical protein